MISSLLIFVSLRARKIVNERSENPYPHSNSISTRSSVSVGEDPNQSIQAFIKYVDLVFSICNCQFFLEVHINQFLIYMLINPAPQQIQNLGEGLFHKSQQMSLRTLKMQIQLLLIHYYKYTKLKFNQAKYSRFCLS